MNGKDYHGLVKDLQEKEWPGKFDPDFEWTRTRGPSGYDTFAPSHHFKSYRPLMTEDIVRDLAINRKRLLSIGCGPAFLEQLLCSRLGVNPSQVSLADLSREGVPEGFTFYQFDMYQEWPPIKDAIDYIIFPECALIGVPTSDDFEADQSRCRQALYNLISRSLRLLNPSGQVRLSGGGIGSCRDAAIERVLSEFPNISYGHTGEEFVYITK